MPATSIMMRYAHSEGHTTLCYEDSGRYLLTCGSDGDVRFWDGLEDDDPISKHAGETVNAICFHNNRYFVASDANSILAYTFPDGSPDGIVARFAAPVTHMCLSEDGNKLLAGSSDFTIKYIQLTDHSFKVLMGHEAPILSVALDPKEQYAASTSCDGSVRIWNLMKQSCVKSWTSVFPSTNDFYASTVLCRILWQPPQGKMFVVPMERCLKFYARDSWDESFKLANESIKEPINVMNYSPCGQYLAVGCIDGIIVVWNVVTQKCIERLKHEKGLTICSLEWNPNGRGEIAYCDSKGQLGAYENVCEPNRLSKIKSPSKNTNQELLALLDDDDDDDNENSFSIAKIKAETIGLESFLSDDGLLHKAARIDATTNGEPEKMLIMPESTQSELQTSFQPGSTPVHYQHRFMVWNTVGIVRSYNTDEENSIDVEFHDTAVHHSLHLDNSQGYTMADVATTSVLLACQSHLETPSKLVCVHFGTWDSSKEWTVDMPNDENIEAIAVSENWAAAATNQRHLRLFSIGNVQKQILTLSGPVVAMAGCGNCLIICYHQALGIPGDQCLGMMQVTLTLGKCKVENHVLPLSPKSTLAWIGFTDEGTPCTADSRGVVRLLPKSIGKGWIQIADTKKHVKSKSNHYFVVGLSESQQKIRCILCKGCKYPATLPHPTVIVLPFELPMCELSCEKGQLEENYWRHSLLLETLIHLDKLGFETDAMNLNRMITQQNETLIKLFALACRHDREFRALEVSQMLDSYTHVEMVIKYASKLKRLQLAQKLGEIAYQKKREENNETQSRQLQQLELETRFLWKEEQTSNLPNGNAKLITYDNHSEIKHEYGYHCKEEEEEDPVPVYGASADSVQNEIIHRQNPFKATLSHDGTRGLHAIDAMTKVDPKLKLSVHMITNTKDGTISNQPLVKNRQQCLLFKNRACDKVTKDITPVNKFSEPPLTSTSQKSGYQLWLETNFDKLKEEHPHTEENKFALIAVQTFKKLLADEKRIWNEKALEKSLETSASFLKRKRQDEKEENEKDQKLQKSKSLLSEITTSKMINMNSKLSGFAFQK